MNHEAVCRSALATPGLIITWRLSVLACKFFSQELKLWPCSTQGTPLDRELGESKKHQALYLICRHEQELPRLFLFNSFPRWVGTTVFYSNSQSKKFGNRLLVLCNLTVLMSNEISNVKNVFHVRRVAGNVQCDWLSFWPRISNYPASEPIPQPWQSCKKLALFRRKMHMLWQTTSCNKTV